MATVSIEQDVVVVRNKEKSKESQTAMNSGKSAFPEIKASAAELTAAQKDFMRKWFSRCEK